MSEHLLEVENLKKYFKTGKGILQAVDDISLTLDSGETLGLVGESGCGKSTTGKTIIRLLEPTAGTIRFNGRDITKISKGKMKPVRREMQIIFQDPYSSLNPRKTVEQLIGEPLKWNKIFHTQAENKEHILHLMDVVGLSRRLVNTYPHELDGGRRQRIGIARALALDPKLIVCDEPVSALDVSVQAQVLNLLHELQKEYNIAYLFITHDLSVVNHFSDEIAVMYLGKIVEKAPSKELFRNPVHPYTKALLSAIPVPDIDVRMQQIPLKGEISSPINMKDDCHFAPRCPYADETCHASCPALRDLGGGHFVACHKY
ncbi:MAG: ATP-binding cassette domain-containing protein [Clostridia bacterium]|nr:ATP-binding cassette domain-containing protein [Clostridia bacterium]